MVLREVVDGQAGLPVPNSTHSYWHKEPSPALLGHRTTAELPAAADTVVIGTGMTGAFAARFLKQADPSGRLLVLEAREACWGATGRNGGHCQPFLYAAAEDVARFELETYRFLADLVAAEGGPDCGWRAVPGVHAMLSPDVWAAARDAVPRLQAAVPDFADKLVAVGPEGVLPVPAAGGGGAPAAVVPDWARGLTLDRLRVGRPGVCGAIVQRHAASMWPYKLVCWVLERLLAEHGAEAFNLQTNTPVTAVTREGDEGEGEEKKAKKEKEEGEGEGQGQQRWVVHTPRGRVVASRVLLATNAYTSRLLPAFADLVVPVRGQVGALLPPGEPAAAAEQLEGQQQQQPRARVGLDASYVFFGTLPGAGDGGPDAPSSSTTTTTTRDEYLVQRPAPGRELILGGGRHLAKNMAVGEWRDDVVEGEVAAWLREELEPVLDLEREKKEEEEDKKNDDDEKKQQQKQQQPGLEASMEWTGIMGYSRDQVPWVGPVPASLGGGDGLFVAAGFTGHGMPRCALAGRGVARMMAGDLEGHGVPRAFVASEERAAQARAQWGPVGTVDEMQTMIADLKAT